MDALLIGTLTTSTLTLFGIAGMIYYTRKNLKTTKYIDTITSERIKWIATIRNEVTDIVASIYFNLKIHDSNIKSTYNETIDYDNDIEAQYVQRSRYFDSPTSTAFGPEQKIWSYSDFVKNLYLFKIRLNPKENWEITEIIDYFIHFYVDSEYMTGKGILAAREKITLLTTHIQELLKQEWKKVENELKER